MAVAAQHDDGRRKLALILAALMLFTPLAVFKYFNFLYAQLAQPLFHLPDFTLGMPLPPGVSFISFTMMAYLADYYRGRYPLERRFGMVSAYMVFFPHLIAGPILRPREIIPQLDRPRRPLSQSNHLLAFALFSVGLVKKLFFADQIASHVEEVYSGATALSTLDYLTAIWGFSFQIYCDFSGYTDMAIGLALLLGVRLPNNFRRPYASASLIEFWRTWHITLSHWLRDYLYIPLGGNRGSWIIRSRNIVVTMLLGGLWHGANWTFVVWGGLHGLAIVANHAWRGLGLSDWLAREGGRPGRWLMVALTFNLVSWLWVPFRAPDMARAQEVAMGPWNASALGGGEFASRHGFLILLLVLAAIWHRHDTHGRLRFLCRNLQRRQLHRLAWVAMGLVWLVLVGVNTGSSGKFIYFDF